MIDFSRFETPHSVERSVLILGGTIKGVVLNPYGGSFEAVPRTLNLPFDTVSRVPLHFSHSGPSSKTTCGPKCECSMGEMQVTVNQMTTTTSIRLCDIM